MSWRELLDQKRVLFQTPPDRAVFWSGWNGGRDPEVCNSAKARRYAEEYSKFTLETTEGGKRLTETYGWFDPSSLFSENEANAVWRYASEHYLKQAEGHVVAFALDRTHPLYSGLSIYQTVERPVLKDRMSTFLSENLTFPEKRSEGSLTLEQKQLLEHPEAKAVLQEIQQWFQMARVEWMKIGTVDCFTHENLTIFLHNHDVNIGGKMTATDRLLSELDKVERLGSVLEEYVLQAKAMIQTWEPIYLSVRALDCYYIKSEKESIEEARVQALRARSSLRRCKDLHGWKENHEWLQHVLHSICYHIYRAFKQLGDFDSARNWQKESLQREISIDEVPALFIEAFSDQESSNGIVNTAIPSKLKNMAHLMAKNTIDTQPVKLDPLQIRKEEEELFNYLPSLTRSNEDMEIQRSQLWQQRMIDLFKLHEESDNNWKKEKTIYETTFQKLFEEFRENQKALKALEDESQELVSQLDTLYSEGEEARRAIEQNPRIARLLTVSLDENTKQFALLNERVSSFQAQYPSKKLELSEAARRSSNALLKLVMEYSNAEIEAKDRERVSVHRLTSIHEIAMMHEVTTKGFQSSLVEETKEVLEIQALYKGTMSNWDRMSEEIDQLLENSSKTKLTGNKSLITKIEALSVEIESISGKDYHSRIAMKAALAIAATARSLRQLKEMIHKMLLGRKDRKHYFHHHEIIEKAKDLQVQAQRRLEKEDLESIRTELNLCADQTRQIFNWSERLMNLSLLNQIEDSLSTRSEDENETVGASPEKSEMLMMLEEQLHLLQQSDSDDSNVSISTLLEVKAIILEKQKKLLEAEKELALRREELETRERLLETEKERLKDNHSLSAHIPPLLENIRVNEMSVELQIENAFHLEEGILHEGEELSVSRQVMEEKSQPTSQLVVNEELVTQVQQIQQQEQQLQIESAKTRKEIYVVRLSRTKERLRRLQEAEEQLELDEGLVERKTTNLEREQGLLLKQKKVVESFEALAEVNDNHQPQKKAAEREVQERNDSRAGVKNSSSQNEEFQVQPQLENENDRGGGSQSIYTSNYWKNDSKAVILDCGSYTCKIGFSGDKGPRVVMPTVVGRAKFATGANTFIGNDVIPKVHTLSRPIQNGTITNWDDMENLWHHFFSSELSIDPSNHPILLTEPIQNQKFNRKKITQIMFERFHVPALYLESQPVLSLYGSGKTTGLVVHSGHSQTVAQPMSDGQRCGNPLFTRVNGATVDAFLCRALRVEGKLTIDQPIKVVSDIKETCGYVALDYRQELKKDSNQVQTPYQLPDGKMITIGSERFQCSEVLFNPTMWIDCDSFREGLNNGIHELISQTIINCDPTLQRDLSSSIILSGGNTMFPGIVERLTKEVIDLNNVQVVASHKRDLLPWIGGSVLSSLSSVQGMWITKAEYDETGPSIVHRKRLIHIRRGRLGEMKSL